MRVLEVVHGFPPAGYGGAELYAHALAQRLAMADGDAVTVLTREHVPEVEEFRVRRECRGAIDVRWINNTFRTTRRFDETYDNPRITEAAARVIDEVRPDLAHVHHLTCLSTTILDELARRQIPIVLTLHDYWLICHRGQLLNQRMQRCDGPGTDGCGNCTGVEGSAPAYAYTGGHLLNRLGAQLPAGVARRLRTSAEAAGRRLATPDRASEASRVRLEHMRERFTHVSAALAPSAHLRDRFIAAGFDAGRIQLWPYGTHLGARAAVPREGSTLRLVFMGSLMVSKAPHLAMDAVHRLHPAVALRVFGAPADYHGDTGYRAAIEARRSLDGVTVFGPVAHERVGDVLADCDALVVTSIWEENSPLVIHEALSAGVPVIASRLGGIPELIRHEVNGLLFTPGDADDLCRQVRRLVDEPDLLDRLRRGITPPRTLDDDVGCTRALYEHLASARPAPSRSIVQPVNAAAAAAAVPAAAVVLNYGTPEQSALAVRMLQRSDVPFLAVVAVDNGDGAALGRALGPREPGVWLLATGANLGFSSGCNAGIRAALERGAGAVLLVNSDAVVPPDCLAALLDLLRREPSVGIAAPVVHSRSWPGVVISAGLDLDVVTGRMRERVSLENGQRKRVDAVSGCVMLVRRAVFETIGLLPDDYFFSFEDIEFCQRARRAGFEVRIEPAARAYHEGSGTIGRVADRLYYASRNHLRLGASLPARSPIHRAARQWAIAGYNVARAVTSRDGRLVSRLAAVTHGVADHLAGRYGAR